MFCLFVCFTAEYTAKNVKASHAGSDNYMEDDDYSNDQYDEYEESTANVKSQAQLSRVSARPSRKIKGFRCNCSFATSVMPLNPLSFYCIYTWQCWQNNWKRAGDFSYEIDLFIKSSIIMKIYSKVTRVVHELLSMAPSSLWKLPIQTEHTQREAVRVRFIFKSYRDNICLCSLSLSLWVCASSTQCVCEFILYTSFNKFKKAKNFLVFQMELVDGKFGYYRHLLALKVDDLPCPRREDLMASEQPSGRHGNAYVSSTGSIFSFTLSSARIFTASQAVLGVSLLVHAAANMLT